MTKVDVFLRVAPMSWVRAGMAISCLAAWKLMPEANLRVIAFEGIERTPWGMKMNSLHPFEAYLPLGQGKMATFHWTSRQWADEHSAGEFYVLADDDRLPMGRDWLDKAAAYWDKYNRDHKYVMLCDRSALWMEDPGKGKRFEGMELPIAEIPQWWMGANYLSYKGAIPYGEMFGPANTQDPDLGRWAAEHGKKQAVMMDCQVNHLGCGFSQVQSELWGRY